MLDYFGTLLTVAMVLFAVGIGLLLTVSPSRRRLVRQAHPPALAAAAVATGAFLVGLTAGGRLAAATGAAVLLGGSVLAWARFGRDWSVRGLVAWSLGVTTAGIFLLRELTGVLTASAGPAALLAGLLVWWFQVFVVGLGLAALWTCAEALARQRWPGAGPSRSRQVTPFVSLHLVSREAPLDQVRELLGDLSHLEYDAYEVIVVETSRDPERRRALEASCAASRRLRLLPLAGASEPRALNRALRRVDARAVLVGLLAEGDRVPPDFLARSTPLFADPGTAFVQAWQAPVRSRSRLGRWIQLASAHSCAVSQRARSGRAAGRLSGTPGLVRRAVLESAGGWDESYADHASALSLRVLCEGGRGGQVGPARGTTSAPGSLEGLRRQLSRDCLGAVQILRRRGVDLVLGRTDHPHRLTPGQRWAQVAGDAHWFGGAAVLLLTGFLLVTAAGRLAGLEVARGLEGRLGTALTVLAAGALLRSATLRRLYADQTWPDVLAGAALRAGHARTLCRATLRALAPSTRHRTGPLLAAQSGTHGAAGGYRVEVALGTLCGALAVAMGVSGAAGLGVLLAVAASGFLVVPVLHRSASLLPGAALPEDEGLAPPSRSWFLARGRRGGLAVSAALACLVGFVLIGPPVGSPGGWRGPAAEGATVPATPPQQPRRAWPPQLEQCPWWAVVPSEDRSAPRPAAAGRAPDRGAAPPAGPGAAPEAPSPDAPAPTDPPPPAPDDPLPAVPGDPLPAVPGDPLPAVPGDPLPPLPGDPLLPPPPVDLPAAPDLPPLAVPLLQSRN